MIRQKNPKSAVSLRLSARRFAFAGLAAMVLAGCAALQPDPQTEVRRLATQRWQALLAGRLADAYEDIIPSYRAVRSLDDYTKTVQNLPVKWLQAEVKRVDCATPDRCKVQLRMVNELRIHARFKGPVESYTEETWVREKGQWWVLESL